MAEKRYQAWVEENEKKFPENQKAYLLKKFGDLNEEQFLACSNLSYKDPMIITILSVVVGYLGVDRFMLGQIGLGILKLCTLGGVGIWWVIDWFLVGKKAKEANMRLLNNSLLVM